MNIRNFSSFPVLTTERLTLRRVSLDDQQSIFALRSDVEINKYLQREPSKNIEDAVDFINKVNDNIEKNTSLYWAITLTETKAFVGTICLFDFSSQENSCEIGYELMHRFQGQGIMKEAMVSVVEYVFHTLKVQKIVAYTHKENLVSINLLSKLGFLESKELDQENPDVGVYTLSCSNF